MESDFVMEPDYKGVEVTYNVYQCGTLDCHYAFDIEHHVEQSLKVLCQRCNSLMEHSWQIDQYTLIELTNG